MTNFIEELTSDLYEELINGKSHKLNKKERAYYNAMNKKRKE